MTSPELSQFFLSLVLLLSAALAGGHGFARLGMPRVIGEIFGGLLLGPSVLGLVAPELQAWLFHGFPGQAALFAAFYWLGMCLLMFTAGFNLSPSLAREDRAMLAALVLGGLVPPFALGWLAAPLLPNTADAHPLAFALVVAIAASVTSIPVISRIFLELGLMGGRFAKLTLAAAALQDLVLWVVLAIATSIQLRHGADFAGLGGAVLVTLAFALAAVLLLPALGHVASRLTAWRPGEAPLLGYAMLLCLAFVATASLLEVNLIFGALLAGLVIARFPAKRFEAAKGRIADMSLWFFVPVYFALVGLKIDLPSDFALGATFGFLVLSSFVKIACVAGAARAAGADGARGLDFGMAMNARGGPGIVLASVAHAAGIVDATLFVAFVLASILTSLAAGSWLRWRLSKGAALAA